MCGKAQPFRWGLFEFRGYASLPRPQEFLLSAMPPDVRKGLAFPSALIRISRLRLFPGYKISCFRRRHLMCGMASPFRNAQPRIMRLRLMHTISRDTPALYFTAVAKDRLPVFRADAIKIITCNALDEARKSAGFSIYAYVIMPDHLHAITDSNRKPSETLRYINGIISRRVIDHLKGARP